MAENDVVQIRGERFVDLCNALIDNRSVMMRRSTFHTDGTCWTWFNRGPKQFTVRYARDTGILDVWHGYCFLRIWHYQQLNELDNIDDTAEWVACWNKDIATGA